jgi:hypothetical protein
MRDTAPTPHPAAPPRPAWQRAALLEATGHETDLWPHPWG